METDELHVPAEAVKAARHTPRPSYSAGDWDRYVRTIAEPVVVAELRRIVREVADAWNAGDLSSVTDGFDMFRDRADELER